MQEPGYRQFLTVFEAAHRMGVSSLTIRRAIWKGDLPAVQPGGPNGIIRIDRDEFEAWLIAHPARTAARR